MVVWASVTLGAFASSMSEKEAKLLARIDQKYDEQVSFLAKVVNINSGTMNVEGVSDVGAIFGQKFQEIGFDTSWIDMPAAMERAGHLVAKRQGTKGRKILLIGHLDTVFPKDTDFLKFRKDEGRYIGPGVTDMKSGNVIVLFALKALEEEGLLEDRRVSVFFTGDEESPGKPLSASRKHLIELAKESDAALNFEAGRQDQAVIARRGSGGWKLVVEGKRAHSSGIFRPAVGVGAIFETARILDGFYNALAGEANLTFNPSVIAGGTNVDLDSVQKTWSASGKSNIVAQTAIVNGDIRYISEAQLKAAQHKMREIVKASRPHTNATITFSESYPPMAPTVGNRELLAILNNVSNDLGYGQIQPNDPGKRGAADISFVAPFVASIDGLGAWGGGSHAKTEWLDKEGFKMATRRAALYIYRLIHADSDT